MATSDPRDRKTLVKETVFSDPSEGIINTRIIAQFANMLRVSDLEDDARKAVMELLVVIALKFAAIWTHDQRYATREAELIEQAKRNPVDRRAESPIRIATAQELYLDFDGFLAQIKSALDHMAVILHYTLGLKFSALTTFGDDGDRIIRMLERNVGKAIPGGKEAAGYLIRHIKNNQDWLHATINIRDKMNHFMDGGVSPRAFAVTFVIEADGRERLYQPRLTPERTVKELMSILFASLLDFVEYFIGVALAAHTPALAIKWVDHPDSLKPPRWRLIHNPHLGVPLG